MDLSPGRTRLALAAVLALALLSRLAVMATVVGGSLDDPDNYLPLARSLAVGQGFCFKGRPTAYRPPLYPLMLAPLVRVFGPEPTRAILALHLALGLGTVALTFATARRWDLSPGIALVAAAIVACDPVLIVQGREIMTETLAAFLLTATLLALAGPRVQGALLGGLGFGLSGLCRPSTLPASGLTALALMVWGPGSWRTRLGRALILVMTTALPLAPWAWRNARVFGEAVWTTTHGGYTLALANNPVYYDEVLHGPPGAVWTGANQQAWWQANNLANGGLSEPKADRALRLDALRTIADRPGDFLQASLARLGRFWALAPSPAVYPLEIRLAVAAWTLPFWLTLGVGVGKGGLWRWPKVTAPAVVIALSIVHAVFWTDMRMRAPIVPALALIASSALRVRGATPNRARDLDNNLEEN